MLKDGVIHLGSVVKTKRFFDFFLALVLALIFLPIFILLVTLIKLGSNGPVLYWSARIGCHGSLFLMPKFRTMLISTPEIASHLLVNPDQYLTPFGGFLRRSSLDELPQLWSILIGDMSFVGPRPALFNQLDLIELRKSYGVDILKPGLTGWAQVNGRDEVGISQKVKFDQEYLQRRSLRFDLKILWITIIKVICRDGVSH